MGELALRAQGVLEDSEPGRLRSLAGSREAERRSNGREVYGKDLDEIKVGSGEYTACCASFAAGRRWRSSMGSRSTA